MSTATVTTSSGSSATSGSGTMTSSTSTSTTTRTSYTSVSGTIESRTSSFTSTSEMSSTSRTRTTGSSTSSLASMAPAAAGGLTTLGSAEEPIMAQSVLIGLTVALLGVCCFICICCTSTLSARRRGKRESKSMEADIENRLDDEPNNELTVNDYMMDLSAEEGHRHSSDSCKTSTSIKSISI